ncbi:MAG: hypothetical protein ACOYB4_05945 [Methyloceanibacter sp.]
MSLLPALRQSSPLVALLLGGALVLLSLQPAEAQRRRAPPDASQLDYSYTVPQRGVGGYSLTLRDIWGPAKMPPAPKDFGPHFDYPPASLNSSPTHSPYPN